MVVRALLILGVVLLTSCTSIFDSYYPDSVEYLENQSNLAQRVGGRSIVAVHMQVFQATSLHSRDLLAAIVTTDDGDQTVVFYSAALQVLKKYSLSQLTALNGGQVPDLFPLSQDYQSLHTGQIAYQFASVTGAPEAISSSSVPALPVYLTPGGGNNGFSQFQSTYYEDVSNNISYPSLFANVGGSVGVYHVGGVSTVYQLVNPADPMLFDVAYPYVNLLGVTCWQQRYYLLFASGGSAYVAVSSASSQPNDMTGVTPAAVKPKDGGSDVSKGWATASAAVLLTHGDNAAVLQAFSWSGKDLGSLRTASSSEDVSLAFHPSGEFWYVYDPSNQTVSQYKRWW